MKNIFFILLLSMFYAPFIRAQEHDHTRNEVGFSGELLYTFVHQEWGFGTHLHYFLSLGLHGKWLLGGGIKHV